MKLSHAIPYRTLRVPSAVLLWAVLGFLVGSGLVPAVGIAADASAAGHAVPPRALDGELTLIDQEARPVRLGAFAGKALLVSFGYTHCPDVCPLTLSLLARVHRRLGGHASQVAVAFVTLDPERDRSAVLKAYVGHFNAGFHGLGGSRAQVDAVAAAFGARYRLRPAADGAGYSVSHTTYTYLVDAAGQLRYAFPFDTAVETITEGVRAVLAEPGAPGPTTAPGGAR